MRNAHKMMLVLILFVHLFEYHRLIIAGEHRPIDFILLLGVTAKEDQWNRSRCRDECCRGVARPSKGGA